MTLNIPRYPLVLYRKGFDPDADQDELEELYRFFPVVHQRTEVGAQRLVIGRYSVLPFYKELEVDLNNQGSTLINTFRQHQFIADMREWVETLGEMTPKLYPRLQDLPEVGPFVLKGETNSKKFLWNTHMFASTRQEAGEVWSRLRDDMLLADQEIYARDYVPLKRLATGMNGLPITMEFRFFVAYQTVLSGGFYWTSHLDQVGATPDPSLVPRDFLQQAIDRIGSAANFYAVDVAQKANGDWTVIEINDGQMSGLSSNDPQTLYGNLRTVVDQKLGSPNE